MNALLKAATHNEEQRQALCYEGPTTEEFNEQNAAMMPCHSAGRATVRKRTRSCSELTTQLLVQHFYPDRKAIGMLSLPHARFLCICK